ncbi:MAG: phosphatase PAP2 family protein [Legionella sp.]|nr:MAG: phosphatase PAP2 family protein [Legionella sp.]
MVRTISHNCLTLVSGFILTLSLLALIFNHFHSHYLGNNYFPDNMLLLISILIVFNLGLRIYYGPKTEGSRKGMELVFFVLIMSVVAIATIAVQFTPFPPIDHHILQWEHSLHIDMPALMLWTQQHPYFKYVLQCIYDSLPYQMSILPLLLIAAGKFSVLRDYYFLLLTTVLWGFLFYYFFPTTAPASVILSPLFTPEQIATGSKFLEIHNHLIPSTREGGLIALPSFHVIWALLCVYLLKDWWLPCLMLLVVNLFLIASCVLLGWHYVIDVVGGLVILFMGWCLLNYCKKLNKNPTTI